MTHRERFNAAVNHRAPDRVPQDLAGCPQTLVMTGATTNQLRKLLNISCNYTGTGLYDDRILEALDTDTRLTGGFPTPQSPHSEKTPDGYVDEWGIRYAQVGGHFEIVGNPLRDLPLERVKEYYYPSADDIDQSVFDSYVAHAKDLYENTDYAVIAQHPCYGVFETGCWMFGFDDFLYRLAAEPETVEWFFERIWQYQKRLIERYYSALGAYIDATTSGDDFGTQRGMFMSVEMFRETVMPFFAERIRYTKIFTNAKFQHHTCGSVFQLIPTLIECGVEILNPIQPNAYLMEPERLKAEYGKSVSFWGGVDTQELLPNGTPEQVREKCAELRELFADGGYILSPAHCIQDDVPVENLTSVYRY